MAGSPTPGATIERLRAVMGDDTFSLRFTVEGEIGRGGMGSVHRAIDRASQQPVAIKLLHASSQHARFVLEAETLERLSHPAIVPYIGHGVTRDGDAYLAMGWLEGESLAERLLRGALSIEDALAAGIRIAGALAHAHAAGIVHRDIKPSNVMLVDKDPKQATLIDFGIAKDTQVTHGLTDTGQLVGTPGYMAPEQAMGTQTLDARTDLFAFGALLHHALSGSPPFEGRQTMEVLAHLLLKDPPNLRELRAEVPTRLATLVGALLVKEPALRSADAKAVEAELRGIAQAVASGDRATLASATKLERPRPPRARWPFVAAGVAVVAIGVTIGFLVMRTDEPAPSKTMASSSKIAPCARDNSCERLCREESDGAACREAGRALTGANPDVSNALFDKGCQLGDPTACALFGTRVRDRVNLGDTRYTREQWIGSYERGCELGLGNACHQLAMHLIAESKQANFDRGVELYTRGCYATDFNTAACVRAAAMLANRGGSGDAERAKQLRATACARGNKPACK